MIKAIVDKIVVQEMKREKSKGGLIIPDSVQEPQAFGRVVSIGEGVEAPIELDQVLVFHSNGGMTMLIEGKFYRVLMEGEVYGIIESDEIIEQLSLLEMSQKDMDKVDQAYKNAAAGAQKEESRIVRV